MWLIEGKEKEMSGSIKYLPENLDIDEFIKNHPTEKIKGFHKEKLVYLLSLIYEIPSNNKDILDKMKDGYVPLYSKLMQNKILNYNEYLGYCVENKLLETDNHYIPEEKSRGYRFFKEYQSVTKKVVIKKNSLRKRSMKDVIKELMDKEKYRYLSKWYNSNLTIDCEAAYEYNEDLLNNSKDNPETALIKYNSNKLSINKIDSQDYLFKVDSNVFRLHTNLVGIKSEFRNYVTYNGKEIVNIDISNSQPYLSTVLLTEQFYEKSETKTSLNLFTTPNLTKQTNKSTTTLLTNLSNIIMLLKTSEWSDKEDIKLYVSHVENGTLYDYFQDDFSSNVDPGYALKNRKEIKSDVFQVLYGDNRSIGKSKTMKQFKHLFPSVYELFSGIKKGNRANLPILLQRIESHLILNVICKRIAKEYPKVPIFTIHDSIATTKENESIIQSIMEEELTKAIGIRPHIKIERWKA